MRFDTHTQDGPMTVRCEELPAPGHRSGEGTETLWPHMARDELQKMTNRGGGRREARAGQGAAHPGRRSTDRFSA